MTPISELEDQLVQLAPDEKLYLIQVLAKSLNGMWNPGSQQTTETGTDNLLDFFQRSPLAAAIAEGEEVDLSRDRSLSPDRFVL